jgi:hypothetical protein
MPVLIELHKHETCMNNINKLINIGVDDIRHDVLYNYSICVLYWCDDGYMLAETSHLSVRYSCLSTAFFCVLLLFVNSGDELPEIKKRVLCDKTFCQIFFKFSVFLFLSSKVDVSFAGTGCVSVIILRRVNELLCNLYLPYFFRSL